MALFKQFNGRERELATLTQLWQKTEATLLILYGRRRVGKTRLIKQWIAQNPGRTLYWVAEPASSSDQLRSFSQALYRFAHPQISMPTHFTYATWQQAWEQVAFLAQTEPFALFVDEFTYVLEINPSVAGTLQNVWDAQLSQTKLSLTLCGSHLGMMQRHMLSYQAPLYGRATRQLHLQPIPFGQTAVFFPHYQPAERVALYAIFGGIPAYWERVNPELSISQNIRQELLTAGNLMQAEPRLLLQDFVREPHNYISILNAIATGSRTQKEIKNRSGLAQGHVSKYLSVLLDAGFVERRIPVTASPRSRLSRYHIKDPYLRFYYRFLASRQAQLVMGEADLALAEIKRHLRDFIGANTWEEICREWTLRAAVRGDIPLTVDQVGSVWTKKAQVDVVGLNRMEKHLVIGECKWGKEKVGRKVLTDLLQKTSEVVPKQGQWQVYYLGFARAGWKGVARTLAQSDEIKTISAGANWQIAGMRLLDLVQVDTALQEWTTDL